MSKKSSEQTHVNSGQRMKNPEHMRAMEECLKVAAQIRSELRDRAHTNSTDLLAEDKGDEPLRDECG